MNSSEIYKVIGLMSGTSLDGLDIAYCVFKKDNVKKNWKFSIEKATTLNYSSAWTEKLLNAHLLSSEALLALDAEYGSFLGKACVAFIQKNRLKVDFISSHGHTIFHQPKRKFTWQLGNGNALHAFAGVPVVYDFRSLDVALGGEGAPLVPSGDRILFNDYNVCLNLGGIANLSMDEKGRRTAFDICFANMGLNYLAATLNVAYDNKGAVAYAGEINKQMLSELSKVYIKMKLKRPSLGREIFDHAIKPILDGTKIHVRHKLRTFTESIVIEIAEALPSSKETIRVLCTGGGAFNSFLISTLLDACGDDIELIIPDDETVKFKEALIFAFLGVLRIRGEVNCIKSVTGASRDCSGGSVVGL